MKVVDWLEALCYASGNIFFFDPFLVRKKKQNLSVQSTSPILHNMFHHLNHAWSGKLHFVFQEEKKQDLVSTFQKTDIRLKIWTLDNIY